MNKERALNIIASVLMEAESNGNLNHNEISATMSNLGNWWKENER